MLKRIFIIEENMETDYVENVIGLQQFYTCIEKESEIGFIKVFDTSLDEIRYYKKESGSEETEINGDTYYFHKQNNIIGNVTYKDIYVLFSGEEIAKYHNPTFHYRIMKKEFRTEEESRTYKPPTYINIIEEVTREKVLQTLNINDLWL